MRDELPERIIDNKLVFNVVEDSSSERAETYISFAKGLPKIIYIENGGEYAFYGDLE